MVSIRELHPGLVMTHSTEGVPFRERPHLVLWVSEPYNKTTWADTHSLRCVDVGLLVADRVRSGTMSTQILKYYRTLG